MAEFALEINNLQKVYDNNVVALKGIDLKVQKGDFYALLGPNGAGKSSTIGIIGSLVTKSAGKVSVFGNDIDTDLNKAKSILKIAVPVAIMVQLTAIIFLLNRDKIKYKNYPIQPFGLFKELRKVLPKNSAITLDAGTLCLQATDALEYYNPPSLFTPLDFGLVGFSFACGLGVKLAKPKKTVVSLMGDGGFGMTISELSTAVEHKINTITIVMNNKSWGAEKAYQKDFFGKRYLGADISSPPFDKVAELYGAKGYKVKKLSEINQLSQTRKLVLTNRKNNLIVNRNDKNLISIFNEQYAEANKLFSNFSQIKFLHEH